MKKALLISGLAAALVLAGCQRQEAAKSPGQPALEKPPAQPVIYTAADLLTAFKEAYGQPAPVETTDDTDQKTIYNPAALVDITPEIVALIVKGEIPDGCHACSGSDSIFYLRHTGKSFELLGRWPNIGGQAEYGHAADWTQRNDLTKYPALFFTSSGGGMGCDITSSDIVELTPSRPILRAQNVITELEYTPGEGEKTPAQSLKGVLSTTGPNHTLQVIYTGTEKFTLEFFLDGDKWEPNPTTHAAPSC